MQLVLKKDEKKEVKVYLEKKGKRNSFTYFEFIKDVYSGEDIGEIRYEGEFSKDEKAQLEAMIGIIKKEILSPAKEASSADSKITDEKG